MLRYLKLFIRFFKFNLSAEMEFRENFYIRLITQAFFVALQIVIVSIFFAYTNSIGSWSKNEVFVLIGIFRLIEGFFHMFIHLNLLSLPEQINFGELDLLLSKPASILFFVSLKRHQLYEATTLLSGLVILWFTHLVTGTNWLNVIWLAMLGLLVLYDIMLIFSSLSFFIPRLTALSSIWDVLSKTARFPLDIFTKYSRELFIIIAPLILVVTLPSQIILGKVPPIYLLFQLAGTAVVTLAAYSFWYIALRHYSSASS